MTTTNPTILNNICSLPSDELQERLAMIRQEILPYVQRTEELPNGFAWEFEQNPNMQVKLEHLVQLERECCSSLTYSLPGQADSNILRLAVEGADPRSGIFAFLGGPSKASNLGGRRLAHLAKAGGLGFGLSFFVCCVLPIGVAALGGAALAAPLAKLDNPVLLAAGAVVMASAPWLFMRRRAARADGGNCGHGC